MRIGHYMNGLWHAGGIASYIRRISAAQRAAGHDVVLFDRVPTTVAASHRGGDDVQTRGDLHLLRAATEHRLDVLHLHTLIDPDLTPDMPVVRTVHGHWSYCPSGSQFLKRTGTPCPRCHSVAGCTWGHFIDRCGSVRPAKFLEDFSRARREQRHHRRVRAIAISDFVRDKMIRTGLDGSMIDVLLSPAPMVTEVQELSQSGASRILFLGRLVPEKGVEWLLRAAAMARSDIAVDICGVGPDQEKLVSLSRELGLQARVSFHGWVDEHRAFEMIRASRAVVFPSLWHEPAGLVTLEAAAHGRAIIASRVGGIPQYAHQLGNAVMVERNDVRALADAINSLAGDADLALRLGRAGREVAETELSLPVHLDGLRACYERAGATCR